MEKHLAIGIPGVDLSEHFASITQDHPANPSDLLRMRRLKTPEGYLDIAFFSSTMDRETSEWLGANMAAGASVISDPEWLDGLPHLAIGIVIETDYDQLTGLTPDLNNISSRINGGGELDEDSLCFPLVMYFSDGELIVWKEVDMSKHQELISKIIDRYNESQNAR